MLHDPDRDLIERIGRGDREAFDNLVLKYRKRVMGVAARMLGDPVEAEDLAQDVFVKVFYASKSFRGQSLFSTWLYRITANACLNRRRKLKREERVINDEIEPALSGGDSNPHSLLENKELKAFLERAIRAIPEEQRLVLILRDIEGLSYEEIAEALALELGTVRSRLHRARLEVQKRLRKVLPRHGSSGDELRRD